jgi:hypothetical protein
VLYEVIVGIWDQNGDLNHGGSLVYRMLCLEKSLLLFIFLQCLQSK